MLGRQVLQVARRAAAPAHVRCFSEIPDPPTWKYVQTPRTVSVVGVPMLYGQGIDGPDKAPEALRSAGLLKDITSLGWRLNDRGDVKLPLPTPTDPEGEHAPKHSFAVGVGNERVADVVEQVVEAGHFSLSLGGDHAMAIGTISGALRKRPDMGVIWVDAHADINRPQESGSGNIHGMPVAFLTRLVDGTTIPGYEWITSVPKLDPNNLVYIGLRDIDGPEKTLIRSLGIKSYTMSSVDRYGIGSVMERAIKHLTQEGDRPLYVSFDIDGCDPSIAPSTGTRVPGGLNWREAHYVVEAAAATGMLFGMDLVEVNPEIGTDEQREMTLSLANDLIKSALGQTIL